MGQKIISLSTERDFYKAAEAVVDAAICCHFDGDKSALPESFRDVLIHAVRRDPELAEVLLLAGVPTQATVH